MFYIILLIHHPKTSFVTRLGDIFQSGPVKVAKNLLLALAVLSPALAGAQTVTLTSGLSTYVGFTNTTVTMTGQCGLVVTGTNNPLSGSTINLNSSNAWFFLPNFRPSVVSASYLSQVKVNGAAAVAGSNCRVDQYVMGTVIVPQSPSFKPLQVFSGQNFLGTSTTFGIYTYYNTSAVLGAMQRNISSFHLKRGYSATFAQNADGSGASKVYVAQDGDLDVGVMATNLDHQCSFVRVFPWRWTGKKGWGGGADSTAAMVNPVWNYDWGNGATSTTDTEYVPMQWGGGYTTGINGTQKSTEVLGYNEPDSTAQANLTVAQAISYWPYMMQSGLRLGAPAVSDSGVTGQGVSWLYSFMSQATNLGYRVDFVPVHSYKCNYTASQLSNYLAGIYQTVGRPIWLTEFNYGADWCSPDNDTSQAVEAANITSYVSMLESCPFIERYAIYQWFGTNRAMVVNGALTPGGVVYANQQSAMAYTQTLPTGGSRSIAEYEFEGNTLDSSGYANHGLATGIPSYTTGHTGQAVALDGTNCFIRLPPNIANSASFTFAAWVNWNGGAQWQRIFDFGDDTSHYLFLTPGSGSGTLRFAINNGSGEQTIETTALPSGSWQHVAVTLSGSSVKLYTNGVLAKSSSSFTITPASFNPSLNYLGKSQFPADPLFRGQLDEVQIADFAFSAAQIATLNTNLPPQFTTNLMTLTNGAVTVAYSSSVAGTATDPDPGSTLTYSKASGPSWLIVAGNGALTGTPGVKDVGTNNFTVRATDSAGASAFANVTIKVSGLSPLMNPGFEAPFTSSYIYNPSGGWWTFTAQSGANGSGVTANNSAFSSGNTNAPEGFQNAFLQGISTISQPLSGFTPGATYNVTFAAALRALNLNGGQTWQVKIDNTLIGDFRPPVSATNYVDYTTNFTATGTTHTLKFVGTDVHGGDNTVFLDNVRLTFVAPPPVPPAPLNFAAAAGDGQVSLSWNTVTFATGYNVKQSTTSGGAYVTNASLSLTSYTDTAVTNGVTYYYVVSALNSGGESTNSAEVSVLPVSMAPPQITSGISDSGQLQIGWPADHLSWMLQVQTNDLNTGLGTNWFSIPDSTTNTQFTVPVVPDNPGVFYRLIHQ